MCGGCAPATGINSPPEGGVHGPLRFACAVPAAPRALPGWGLHPQDPQGCAPWCAFAHRAPAASVTQPEGFRARVRRWRGWASRRLVHARRLAPPLPLSPGFSFSKVGQPERGQAAGLSTRGRQSLQRRRWADPGTARRAAVHLGWAAGLSTATAGSGRSGSSEQSNRANIFSFAQPTRAKPRQYWVSREPLYKKIGDPNCTTLCNLTTKMQSKQQLSTF